MNDKRTIAFMLIRQRFRDAFHLRNTKGDKITICETFLCKQGDKIMFATKGHIVNIGLIQLINLLSMGNSSLAGGIGGNFSTWNSKVQYMRVGTGAGVTGYSTTSLTTQTATAADSQSASVTNPSNGVFKLNLTSTWNAGTLTAITISEIGLYAYEVGNTATMQAFAWANGNVSATIFMFSRISAADGDFTAFAVNTSVPLTLTWTLSFTFA